MAFVLPAFRRENAWYIGNLRHDHALLTRLAALSP